MNATRGIAVNRREQIGRCKIALEALFELLMVGGMVLSAAVHAEFGVAWTDGERRRSAASSQPPRDVISCAVDQSSGSFPRAAVDALPLPIVRNAPYCCSVSANRVVTLTELHHTCVPVVLVQCQTPGAARPFAILRGCALNRPRRASRPRTSICVVSQTLWQVL